jgi:hypothetical protein
MAGGALLAGLLDVIPHSLAARRGRKFGCFLVLTRLFYLVVRARQDFA